MHVTKPALIALIKRGWACTWIHTHTCTALCLFVQYVHVHNKTSICAKLRDERRLPAPYSCVSPYVTHHCKQRILNTGSLMNTYTYYSQRGESIEIPLSSNIYWSNIPEPFTGVHQQTWAETQQLITTQILDLIKYIKAINHPQPGGSKSLQN